MRALQLEDVIFTVAAHSGQNFYCIAVGHSMFLANLLTLVASGWAPQPGSLKVGGQVVVDGSSDVEGCRAHWQREGLRGNFVAVPQIDAKQARQMPYCRFEALQGVV